MRTSEQTGKSRRYHRGFRKIFAVYFTLAFLSLGFLSAASPVLGAEIQYVPLAPIEGTYDEATGATNLGVYLVGIFKVGVAAAGALAFLIIVWGGFTYLSTDAITGKEEGKERIERAVGGLILALASYIILNSINPALVRLDLDFGPPANPAEDMATPGDLMAQKEFDEMIAAGHIRLIAASKKAQDLEALAKEYQTQIETLPFDDPENPERKALEQLTNEAVREAATVRTYESHSQNIVTALANGKKEISQWADLDKQTMYLKQYVDSVNNVYREGEGKLLALGKTAEVAKLNTERQDALIQLCNSASRYAKERVSHCNYLINAKVISPGN
jgi:hypothetical protein